MFSWFKTKGGRNTQARRAFRPAADALESREVLSTVAVAPRPLAIGVNLPHPSPSLNILTRGLAAPSLYGHQNALSTAGKAVTNVAGIVSSVIAQTTFPVISTGRSVSTTSTRAGTPFTTNAALNSALNTARSLVSVSSTGIPNLAATTNFLGQSILNTASNPFNTATSVLNGLAFTNNAGFSVPVQSAGTLGTSTNGLAFTNGTGFSVPSRTIGTTTPATNGLAFTNNTGFAAPSRNSGTATNGLAFTNGTGLSIPVVSAGLGNASTNGLVFSNGTGFSLPAAGITVSGSGFNVSPPMII